MEDPPFFWDENIITKEKIANNTYPSNSNWYDNPDTCILQMPNGHIRFEKNDDPCNEAPLEYVINSIVEESKDDIIYDPTRNNVKININPLFPSVFCEAYRNEDTLELTDCGINIVWLPNFDSEENFCISPNASADDFGINWNDLTIRGPSCN